MCSPLLCSWSGSSLQCLLDLVLNFLCCCCKERQWQENIKSARESWWIHTARPENIAGIGDPLLLFWFLFANFKDLGMCQAAPMSTLAWGLRNDAFYPEIQFGVWLNRGPLLQLCDTSPAHATSDEKDLSPSLALPPLWKSPWCSPQTLSVGKWSSFSLV